MKRKKNLIILEMIYLWIHVSRSLLANGRARLWASAVDAHRTNRTKKTTATNLLKMTFTNKLFGIFFLLVEFGSHFGPYPDPAQCSEKESTLKMGKYFRHKISHQFSLARARTRYAFGRKMVSMFLSYESNRSGKRSAAHDLRSGMV